MAAGASHQGDRADQADTWLVERRPGAVLCAVCDGMGAGCSGRPAADLTVALLSAPFVTGADVGRVLAALEEANRAICERAEAVRRREPGVEAYWSGQGTTADVALFERGRAHLAHVGDGRTYRHRAGRLEALTTDHTLVNDYRRLRPDSTAEELAQVPRGVIVRALGMKQDVAVDRSIVATAPGDRFVLCSDGVTAWLDDGAIAALLDRYAAPHDAARAIVDAAYASTRPVEGAGPGPFKDNATAVVHVVGDGGY
jgi:protein phosphatase